MVPKFVSKIANKNKYVFCRDSELCLKGLNQLNDGRLDTEENFAFTNKKLRSTNVFDDALLNKEENNVNVCDGSLNPDITCANITDDDDIDEEAKIMKLMGLPTAFGKHNLKVLF